MLRPPEAHLDSSAHVDFTLTPEGLVNLMQIFFSASAESLQYQLHCYFLAHLLNTFRLVSNG
jgi:hypothetical protein